MEGEQEAQCSCVLLSIHVPNKPKHKLVLHRLQATVHDTGTQAHSCVHLPAGRGCTFPRAHSAARVPPCAHPAPPPTQHIPAQTPLSMHSTYLER